MSRTRFRSSASAAWARYEAARIKSTAPAPAQVLSTADQSSQRTCGADHRGDGLEQWSSACGWDWGTQVVTSEVAGGRDYRSAGPVHANSRQRGPRPRQGHAISVHRRRLPRRTVHATGVDENARQSLSHRVRVAVGTKGHELRHVHARWPTRETCPGALGECQSDFSTHAPPARTRTRPRSRQVRVSAAHHGLEHDWKALATSSHTSRSSPGGAGPGDVEPVPPGACGLHTAPPVNATAKGGDQVSSPAAPVAQQVKTLAPAFQRPESQSGKLQG